MENDNRQYSHDDHDDNGDNSRVTDQDENQRGNATNARNTAQNHRHIGRWERYKQSWKKTAGWNKIMVLLTAVIAVSTGFYARYERRQLGVMAGQLKQMEGSSRQTDQLIYLYQQQVEKLGEQINKLDLSIGATNRVAVAGETSNKHALESERPWMGSNLQVTDFELEKKPAYLVTFENTGKRPVRTILFLTLATHNEYGINPRYPAANEIQKKTTSFVVPGAYVNAPWSGDTVTPLHLLENGTMVYAALDYVDARTHTRYWSHACWRYVPLVKGFLTCQNSYTDAN